jgi:hypothetical protein
MSGPPSVSGQGGEWLQHNLALDEAMGWGETYAHHPGCARHRGSTLSTSPVAARVLGAFDRAGPLKYGWRRPPSRSRWSNVPRSFEEPHRVAATLIGEGGIPALVKVAYLSDSDCARIVAHAGAGIGQGDRFGSVLAQAAAVIPGAPPWMRSAPHWTRRTCAAPSEG